MLYIIFINIIRILKEMKMIIREIKVLKRCKKVSYDEKQYMK
jgi:hypothetical protein